MAGRHTKRAVTDATKDANALLRAKKEIHATVSLANSTPCTKGTAKMFGKYSNIPIMMVGNAATIPFSTSNGSCKTLATPDDRFQMKNNG